jgi:hypothetical protein
MTTFLFKTLLAYYKKDEPWRHYADWNKSDGEEQIWCDSTYMRIEWLNL